MAKKIDIAGELNAATTEGIIADSSQIRYKGKTVEEAMDTYGDLEGMEAVTSDEIDGLF